MNKELQTNLIGAMKIAFNKVNEYREAYLSLDAYPIRNMDKQVYEGKVPWVKITNIVSYEHTDESNFGVIEIQLAVNQERYLQYRSNLRVVVQSEIYDLVYDEPIPEPYGYTILNPDDIIDEHIKRLSHFFTEGFAELGIDPEDIIFNGTTIGQVKNFVDPLDEFR